MLTAYPVTQPKVKQQIEASERLAVIGRSVEKMKEALSYSDDASLVYAGYPYDPFRPDKSAHCGASGQGSQAHLNGTVFNVSGRP
jgi:hypothetical protein